MFWCRRISAPLPGPSGPTDFVLRPATVDDVESTWQIRRLPAVSKWMTSGADDRTEFAATFLQADRLAKILIVELDGRQIGDLMVSVEDAWAQTEVADQAQPWSAGRARLGHRPGLCRQRLRHRGSECIAAHLLRRVGPASGLRPVFRRQRPSWRIMEKLGMRREEYTIRDSLHRSGQWMDGMRYAILLDEWQARPAGTGSAT